MPYFGKLCCKAVLKNWFLLKIANVTKIDYSHSPADSSDSKI